MATIMRKLPSAIKSIRGPDCVMVSVTIAIIPMFYLGEICTVVPKLYERWSFWFNVHFVMSLFFLHNIVGNLAQGLQGPGNVRDDVMPPPAQSWRYCSTCECQVPPRSWHCSICEVCIFKRDHHCNFFGCCIGYFNFRYFYMFVLHVFLGTVYALVLNILFFKRHVDFSEIGWLSLFSFIFPFASLVVDLSALNGYILLLVLNIVFTIFTGYLFFYHTRILIIGKTVGESKHPKENYDRGWKRNFSDGFGKRWYLVWFSAFFHSPLPGDGTHWKQARE